VLLKKMSTFTGGEVETGDFHFNLYA
jgi:hypothetical protein